MESRFLQVPPGLDGIRADAGIAKLLGLSRTTVADVLAASGATLDGRVLSKSDRLVADAWLDITWHPKQAPRVVPMEVPGLQIIYQDADIVVVDKPAGVAAHPSMGWTGPTVLGALAAGGFDITTSGAAERQGIVHRLDVGTSGLMVVAKSERAYTHLKTQFHDRLVRKVYHAAVQGHPDPLLGTIDAPIGRHPGNEWKFAVTEDGKHAITHYEAIEAFRHGSLVEVDLETGRTHQIRVHMSARRHPCFGDTMYGADPRLSEWLGLDRQWLHALELGFTHPGGQEVEYRSEYAPDLADALELLRDGA